MLFRKLGLVLIVVLLVGFLAGADETEAVLKSIKGGDIFEIAKAISSPEMEGRLAGTEGYNRAAAWAAARFKEWKLKPVYGQDYLQPFRISYNEMRETSLSLFLPAEKGKDEPRPVELEIYKDFCPTLYSGFGDVETEVVFAGFGISDEELGWDDYRGVDVKGKIAAILQGTPQVEGKDFSKYIERHPKLWIAKKKGAAGLLLLQGAVVSGNGDYVEGLPMAMVGEKVWQSLFASKGYNFEAVRALCRDGHHLSFSTGVRAKLKSTGVHHDNAETFNVVGMIEGRDQVLKQEYIIFGGHLDGIGPWPVLHPGANDNASGSAVVMGLAQAFSRLKMPPKRTLVFALFSGEELGLHGSKHMATNLPRFPSKPLLMVNHDMNGTGNSLVVAGGKAYPEMYGFLEKANEKYSLLQNLSASEISPLGGNSDYAPFLAKGIPAYSNWTRGGRGGGTHTADDSIYFVTPKIMEDIVRLYFAAAYEFANR
ncbi:MAG: M28 family peptidase [Clostridiales bacterium]|nr:M28 family peptidase [Clostridiales bacterium]